MSRHRAANAPVRRGVAHWPLVSAAVVVLVVLAWLGWTWIGSVVDRQRAAERNCVEGNTTLHVVAAPGIADALGAAATAWNDTAPVVADSCVTARVREMAPALALSGLSGSWDAARLGPRPSAWVPESSLWVNRLSAQDGGALGSDPTSIATSPVVLAVPPVVSAALVTGPSFRWSDLPRLATDPAGWSAYGRPEWGPVTVALPDVATNPPSALALQSVLAGSSARGQGPVTVPMLSEPGVAEAMASLAAAVAPNAPGGTADALRSLDEMRADPATAPYDGVPVLEQDLYRHNTGIDGNRPAGDPLVGIPVAGPTPTADFPFVAIAGDDRTAVQAAQVFRRFVQEPAQQDLLTAAGLRVGTSTDFPVPSPGIRWAATPEALAPADTNTTQQIASAWASAAQGGQSVTLLVDVSRSMNSEGGQDRSRLDWTQEALRGQVQRSVTGAIGLWEFSRGRDGDLPYRQLVETGPVGERRGELLDSIDGLTAASATDLNESLLAVYEAAVDGYREGRPNRLVVITDSPDDSDVSIDELLDGLDSLQDDDRPVQVSVIALGPDPDRGELEQIAEATDGTVSIAEGGADLEPALGELLSDRGD